ncbi:putative Microspherule protein 1 [Cocos nucifera]|uniref:Putative Microspherule protein 1 n=1 Tax=Cocos nucifera TaxID=13894 RepID=A0A8K0ICK7_COCNU|nr:putative Microspherule protein 1 [Cocos nucifera]
MMGAPTTLTKWIPEDDLLLKNAVEAGASLESLAKGAVRFSRRFTLQELQDRWYSLLYNSDISAEASARIIEFEIELSISNPPKANRACISKGKDSLSGKRKGDSVRSHYYTKRKRVCHEPCSSANPGFLVPHCPPVTTGNIYGYGDQLEPQSQHHVDNISLGPAFLNCYKHQGTGYCNGQHDLSDIMRVDSSAASGSIAHHAFHTEHVSSVEGELPDGIVNRNCLYGYAENISSVSIDKAGENNGNQPLGHENIRKDHLRILGEDLTSFKACSDGQEIKPLQPLPTSNLYDHKVKEAKPLPNVDPFDGNENDFPGNNKANLQVSESEYSFDQLGCSSSALGLPIWGMIQNISAPTLPLGVHVDEKESEILIVNESKNMDAPRGVTSEPKSNDGMSDAGLGNAAMISEGDFVDFSSIDFADDEELLFVDVDEKDVDNNSCLDGLGSMLLNSPSDTHQDDVPNSSGPEATKLSASCIMIPEGACSGGTNDNCDKICSGHDNGHGFHISKVNQPSSSLKMSHIIDPLEGSVICMLNTEDPEIPCNDDVFLPTQVIPQVPKSTQEHNPKEQNDPISSSIKMLSNDGKHTAKDLTMAKEEQVGIVQPLLSSMEAKSSMRLKVGTIPTADGRKVEAESFKINSVAGVSRLAGIAVDDPNISTSATIALPSAPFAAKEGTTQDPGKPGKSNTINCFIVKPVLGSDHSKLYSLRIADGCKEEIDIQATQWNFVPLHADSISAEFSLLDPVANMSTSDQEQQISDNENEVPSFSDIEAMLLDMDLGPYDQDSSLFTKEVSRYQSVCSKKAIMRLEQGARSFMNRAISSHGAFAVFYGHHMKYFIKSPEVSLGRATEDVKVDINLGREGCANKISRRQAIIRMDDDGSFLLKNTGKCSIFVNSKEVAAKKRINLSSGCLIQVQG